MNTERPVGLVRIIKATPRDPEFSDQPPWYAPFLKYSLREYRVYLDSSLEYPLVDPTIAGVRPSAYAAISRCDAEIVG